MDNVTLTIQAGVIVKFADNSGLSVANNAQLLALGTANEPVVFTSIKDDSQGGDSNGDGDVTVPTPGIWSTLDGYGTLSTLRLQHVLVRYGRTLVEAHGHLLLQDSTLEQNNYDGVYVYPNSGTAPNVTIERTVIRANSHHSINIYGHPGTITVRDNNLEGNDGYAGISFNQVAGAQVTGNTITVSGDYQSGRGIILTDSGGNNSGGNNSGGNNLLLQNNTITRTVNSKAVVGIEVQNGQPQLNNNRISGFEVAVLLNGGYPVLVPTYSGNDFHNNEYGASIAVTGNLQGGSWVHAGGHPHFVWQTATLEANATLSIPSGMVLKFSPNGYLSLGAKAQLVAHGTLSETVILTSIRDDSFGGDSNGDGGVTVPQPADWYGIEGTGSLSTIDFAYVSLRFARNAITARGNLTLRNSMIIENASSGVTISSNSGTAPTLSIQETLVKNSLYGIYLDKVPTDLQITNNAFLETRTGVYNNDSQTPVDASRNWWGDPQGPKHTSNPQGQGAAVSDNVNFSNWLTVEPAYVPLQHPTTPVGTPSGAADRFEPDNNCSQAGLITSDGSAQERTFHSKADADWVQFSATQNVKYRVEVQTPVDSLADVNLEIYAQCNTLPNTSWQESFTPGVRIDFTATQTGPLYLYLTNSDKAIYGDQVKYRLSVREIKNETQPQGAVIILAGRLKENDRLQANIHQVTNSVYAFFKSTGYTDENIYYLAKDTTLPGWDADATLSNLQSALTTWAVDKVGVNRPLTIYMMDHGGIDTFYVDGTRNQQLTPGAFDAWLSQLESAAPGVKTNVLIEACYSGSFIEGAKRISKAGRLLITSTNAQNVAFASAKGAQFSDRFLTSLREGYSINNSFWDAQYSVRRLFNSQEPWIDVNGNGIPNETEDGAEAAQHNVDNNTQPADLWAPYIVFGQAPAQIVEGKGVVRAEVRDNKGVKKVWAAIYAPSYRFPASVEELVPEDVPIINLIAMGNNQYSVEYDKFNEVGVYRLALYAEDSDGLKARLLALDVSTGSKIFLPLVAR